MLFKKKKKLSRNEEKFAKKYDLNINNDPDDIRLVNNNLRGIELEKEGRIDEAIKLYEENIKKDFDGNHPYDRLAIIYRKRKEYDEEIRVIKHAIKVFERLSKTSSRGAVSPKLNRFIERLDKAEKLKGKN